MLRKAHCVSCRYAYTRYACEHAHCTPKGFRRSVPPAFADFTLSATQTRACTCAMHVQTKHLQINASLLRPSARERQTRIGCRVRASADSPYWRPITISNRDDLSERHPSPSDHFVHRSAVPAFGPFRYTLPDATGKNLSNSQSLFPTPKYFALRARILKTAPVL